MCSVFFGIDLVVEITIELNKDELISFSEATHLILEMIAECGLILAVYLSLTSYGRLKEKAVHDEQVVTAIRTGFDRILEATFAEWSLTEAQKDIALLSVRGQSISEIAETRQTKAGTVKAHLHQIYQKASVGSRTELLAVLMDELLSSHNLDPKDDGLDFLPA